MSDEARDDIEDLEARHVQSVERARQRRQRQRRPPSSSSSSAPGAEQDEVEPNILTGLFDDEAIIKIIARHANVIARRRFAAARRGMPAAV